MAAAMPLGERALQLDDASPEAHLFLANARYFERDWALAEKSYLKAVELAPNAAEIHGGYAAFLLIRRRFEEALAEVRLAQKLDPLSPTWNTWTCSWIALAGKREEGTVALERVAALHPNHWLPHHFLSVLYALASRLEEAKVEGERAVELSGGISATVTQLACVCYMMGDKTRADELFEKLQQRAHASYVPPTFLAWIHLARGEADTAFELLKEAARVKDPWLGFHRFQSPAPQPEDPRIDALLEGLGL
jgi:Tfp pilus assembly protein PilF